MEFQSEQVSAIKRKLSFSVPGQKVTAELNRAFSSLQKNMRLPGFRPGKTPRKVIEQRFGAKVRSDVASDLINKAFRQHAAELEFFGQPQIAERGDVKAGSDFNFAILLEVRPELELGPYTGVSVDFPEVNIPEDAVEANIQARLRGQSVLTEVTDRKDVQAGDKVLAEIEASADGEVVHSHPGTLIDTQGERYYTGLESELIGLKKGGKGKTLKGITFSESAQLDDLAGKTFDVKVKISGIQAMTTPELSDSVAEEMGYEGGAAGMRAAIQAQLEESANGQARNQARANLLQVLIDANAFDAPSGLVDQQLKALLEELRIQRAYSGQDVRNWQPSDAEMADYRNRATFAAKASLILDHVSKAEKVTVSDAEIEAKYQEIADARGQRVEAIKGYFEKEGAIEDLRDRLLEEKTLDWLLERAELNTISAEDAAAKAAEKAEAAAPAAAPAAEAAPAEEAPAAEAAAADEDLSGKTSAELKAMAKDRGLKGYSKLKKAELIALLQG